MFSNNLRYSNLASLTNILDSQSTHLFNQHLQKLLSLFLFFQLISLLYYEFMKEIEFWFGYLTGC